MAGTPLTDAINALTTYSNTVTGASDTTLSEAVATLAAGYGGGGTTPTGFVEETTYTVPTDITGSNNSFSFLESICPALDDTTDYHLYIFIITNNTASTKRAIFALFQRTGASNYTRLFARSAGSTVTYAGGVHDWNLTAGSVAHILKFNSRLGME